MKSFNSFMSLFLASIIIAFLFVSCAENKKEETKDKPEKQEITAINSKISGGSWHDPNTWVEGVCPTEKSDVVISGKVTVEKDAKCLNLIVSPEATLEVLEGTKLEVLFHLIQEGRIINNGEVLLETNKK